MSPKKCQFGYKEGTLLGHVIFKEGIWIEKEKIRKILKLYTSFNRIELNYCIVTQLDGENIIKNIILINI